MPKRTPPEPTSPEPNEPKRRPGRPKKGFTKVLVSLDPTQAQLLATAALIRGAVEGKRGDVSALIREIIEKSEYWRHLSDDVLRALEAINKSPLARERMDRILGPSAEKRDKPTFAATASAIREGYLAALHDPSPGIPFLGARLAGHVLERLRAQAAAAVVHARERAGFTPAGLAKRSGLSLKKVELAEQGFIDGEIASKLAVPLEVDPHDLCPPDLWPTKKSS